jgi:hypothetical protein
MQAIVRDKCNFIFNLASEELMSSTKVSKLSIWFILEISPRGFQKVPFFSITTYKLEWELLKIFK